VVSAFDTAWLGICFAFVFLLPFLIFVTDQDCSGNEMHFVLVGAWIFGFSLWMIRRLKTDSKLCASMTRHATGGSPRLHTNGSTCKGGAAPRCIPPQYADKAEHHA
jgi:hypothetical protein